MTKKFKVCFELWTEDKEFTEADAQAEIERFAWSTVVNVKNVEVGKQR